MLRRWVAGRGVRVSHPRKWKKKVQARTSQQGTETLLLPVSHTFLFSLGHRCPAGVWSWPAWLTHQPGWRRSEMLCRCAGQAEAWGLPLFLQELIGLESRFCLGGDRRAVFTSHMSRDTAEATRLGESERMLICVA